MKPILEWYEQLREPYRSQAIENYDDEGTVLAQSMSEAIGGGFLWLLTEQGLEYWKDVSDRAARGEFDDPITKLKSLITQLEQRQEQFEKLLK